MTTSNLQEYIFTTIELLPTLQQYSPIIHRFKKWLDDQSALIRAVEICLAQPPIGSNLALSDIAPAISAWALLCYIAGPLDNYVDKDKDMGIWTEMGRDSGTFVATALIGEALLLSSSSKAEGLLSSMLRDSSLGQIMDIRGVSSLIDYQHMTALKSGSLFKTLFLIVPTVADVSESIKQALAVFGETVGGIIQIHNDTLGIWQVGAYNTFSDLQKPQLTLPILYALNHDSPQAKQFATLLNVPPQQRNIQALQNILDNLPTRTFLKVTLLAYRVHAQEALSSVLDPTTYQILLNWLDDNFLCTKQEDGSETNSTPKYIHLSQEKSTQHMNNTKHV